MTILHITSRPEWLSAEKRGLFAASTLMSEGFIHCSTPEQVVPVANALYRGQSGLVLLVMDENRLKPEIRWEAPAGAPAEGISPSDLFPHIYGPVNVDAVVNVLDFMPDPAGNFALPALN
jgi:uncharacterized protein (DUF952 family)